MIHQSTRFVFRDKNVIGDNVINPYVDQSMDWGEQIKQKKNKELLWSTDTQNKLGQEIAQSVAKEKENVRLIQKGDTLGAIVKGLRGGVDWGLLVEYRGKGKQMDLQRERNKTKTLGNANLIYPGQFVWMEEEAVIIGTGEEYREKFEKEGSKLPAAPVVQGEVLTEVAPIETQPAQEGGVPGEQVEVPVGEQRIETQPAQEGGVPGEQVDVPEEQLNIEQLKQKAREVLKPLMVERILQRNLNVDWEEDLTFNNQVTDSGTIEVEVDGQFLDEPLLTENDYKHLGLSLRDVIALLNDREMKESMKKDLILTEAIVESRFRAGHTNFLENAKRILGVTTVESSLESFLKQGTYTQEQINAASEKYKQQIERQVFLLGKAKEMINSSDRTLLWDEENPFEIEGNQIEANAKFSMWSPWGSFKDVAILTKNDLNGTGFTLEQALALLLKHKTDLRIASGQ